MNLYCGGQKTVTGQEVVGERQLEAAATTTMFLPTPWKETSTDTQIHGTSWIKLTELLDLSTLLLHDSRPRPPPSTRRRRRRSRSHALVVVAAVAFLIEMSAT
ncbi:hypothetical protein U9M48_001452 [Paspalum notatum var. saurae]|uniref:Uncharacterized protein n=1 Tax=Paspalum notatum var. saurae TaxID=547442 RepID=A0AAQ3PID0_PASNO